MILKNITTISTNIDSYNNSLRTSIKNKNKYIKIRNKNFEEIKNSENYSEKILITSETKQKQLYELIQKKI